MGVFVIAMVKEATGEVVGYHNQERPELMRVRDEATSFDKSEVAWERVYDLGGYYGPYNEEQVLMVMPVRYCPATV